MKGCILLIVLFSFDLWGAPTPKVVLNAISTYEVWEGDQLEATLTIPNEFNVGANFDLKDGLYLLDIKDKKENVYVVSVIVTDRDKINEVLLEAGERKFPVEVRGIQFKGDKITEGSYIFGQTINGNNRFLFFLIFLFSIFIISAGTYFYRIQKQKRIAEKLKQKRQQYITLINRIKDKETFNDFYYKRFNAKDIFKNDQHHIDDFLKKSDHIVYKNVLAEEDAQFLTNEKKKLIKKLEASDGI